MDYHFFLLNSEVIYKSLNRENINLYENCFYLYQLAFYIYNVKLL